MDEGGKVGRSGKKSRSIMSKEDYGVGSTYKSPLAPERDPLTLPTLVFPDFTSLTGGPGRQTLLLK
jgi:hypothetical protein